MLASGRSSIAINSTGSPRIRRFHRTEEVDRSIEFVSTDRQDSVEHSAMADDAGHCMRGVNRNRRIVGISVPLRPGGPTDLHELILRPRDCNSC
jgi:hypothetical protein